VLDDGGISAFVAAGVPDQQRYEDGDHERDDEVRQELRLAIVSAQMVQHPLPVRELTVVQRTGWARRETLEQRPYLADRPSPHSVPFTEKAIKGNNAAGHRRLLERDDIRPR
jgi:hypothetical protein